ncbi:hypothetical protein CCHL11_06913 [Colletotrichum chlorophyti]|uniref:Uncharacterized protein n=1 Tax=Colletotrichum chlorophyti TaxID=708187 RepID=A0A1Q8RBU1_9PEZI|nr:hypothetical protein CCHL11_06913 [Colletotrichum chlorophyti]
MLHICMQRGLQVPPALVKVTTDFETSVLRIQYHSLWAGTLAILAFQIVNLRAAAKL